LVIAKAFTSGTWLLLRLGNGGVAFDEVDPVGVDDTMVTTTDPEVVGDKDDRSFGWSCHPGLSWTAETTPLFVSTALFVSTTTTSTPVVVAVTPLVMSVVSLLH